jgi:hypothetical protein
VERTRTVVAGRGKRAQTWRVRSIWPDGPTPEAWERVNATLLALMLPKARALIAEREKKEAVCQSTG